MNGMCRPLRREAILPPPLLAGVLILLDGVLNIVEEDDVDGGAAAFPILLHDPGVFCSCCARVAFFD